MGRRCEPGDLRILGVFPYVLANLKRVEISSLAMLAQGAIVAGRYRIHEHIAQGGMGVIYEAEHLATEQRVALKVLWPHVLGSKAAVESFQLEARLAARIGGEHIARILDAGFDDRLSLPFLSMELLRGTTLRQLVQKEGRLSPPETVAVLRQVAKALDKAHGHVDRDGRPAPVVHRDLKPENLFLAQREGGGTIVKVLDFGIAKVLSGSQFHSQEVRGTPPYMAYEQFASGPVTPRLDLWALGLIVFYLLTGRAYWLSTGSGVEGVGLLLSEILVQPLTAPTERAREFGFEPSWTEAFDAWFFRCVHRDPTARFGSAGEAAAALGTALGGGVGFDRAALAEARTTLAERLVRLVGEAVGADSTTFTSLLDDDNGSPVPRARPSGEDALGAEPRSAPVSGPRSGPGSAPEPGASPRSKPRAAFISGVDGLAPPVPWQRTTLEALEAENTAPVENAPFALTPPSSREPVPLRPITEAPSRWPGSPLSRALGGALVVTLVATVATLGVLRTKQSVASERVEISSASPVQPAALDAGAKPIPTDAGAKPTPPSPVVVPADREAEPTPSPPISSPGPTAKVLRRLEKPTSKKENGAPRGGSQPTAEQEGKNPAGSKAPDAAEGHAPPAPPPLATPMPTAPKPDSPYDRL
jgi:serine/threonine protein kinase